MATPYFFKLEERKNDKGLKKHYDASEYFTHQYQTVVIN